MGALAPNLQGESVREEDWDGGGGCVGIGHRLYFRLK